MFKITNGYGDFECKSFPEDIFWESIISELSQNKLNKHQTNVKEVRSQQNRELLYVDICYNIILHKPIEFKTKIPDRMTQSYSHIMPGSVPSVLPTLPFDSFMSDFFIVCINFDYINKKVCSMHIEEVYPTNIDEIGSSSTWKNFVEWRLAARDTLIIFKDR